MVAGQAQIELIYYDEDNSFITLDIMNVNVISSPPPTYSLVLNTVGMTNSGGNYHITLNNDSDLTGYREFNINARIKINGVAQPYDQDITYSFVTEENNNLYNENWVDINSSTGKVSLHNPYVFDGFAHEVGSITVKIQYNQDPTKVRYVILDVICEDMAPPTANGDDLISVVGGRHLRIPFSGIPNNTSNFISCMSANNMTSEIDPYNYSWQYYSSTDWLAYHQTGNGITRYKRFFELIRNSKVSTIVTHGAPTNIRVNSEESIIATSGDILELHQGYFKYCNLILLISCSTGSQTNNETNVAQAFADKGTGAVIAFTNDVDITAASSYETELYTLLSAGYNIHYAFSHVSIPGCSPTIKGNRTNGYISD